MSENTSVTKNAINTFVVTKVTIHTLDKLISLHKFKVYSHLNRELSMKTRIIIFTLFLSLSGLLWSQSSINLSWDSPEWNDGADWTDNSSAAEMQSLTTTLGGTNFTVTAGMTTGAPAGGTPGPNVDLGSNPFGPEPAMRLTNSLGESPSREQVKFQITFSRPIFVNDFSIGGFNDTSGNIANGMLFIAKNNGNNVLADTATQGFNQANYVENSPQGTPSDNGLRLFEDTENNRSSLVIEPGIGNDARYWYYTFDFGTQLVDEILLELTDFTHDSIGDIDDFDPFTTTPVGSNQSRYWSDFMIVIPEPGSIALAGIAFSALALSGWRRSRK